MAQAKVKTTTKKVVKKTVAAKPVRKAAVKKTAPVKAKTEKKTLDAKLNPKVWEIKLNADLVAQVLYVQQSNARQGNAHAKTRAMVRGGGRKPWKQKGTGRARHGSIRSPLWRKGGVTFPPNWRNWERKINKQMVKKAICMLLSERLKGGNIEFVNIETKGSKDLRNVLMGQMEKGLVISENMDAKMALSNVKTIDFSTPSVFSVVNLMKAKKILVDNKSVEIIEKRLLNGK